MLSACAFADENDAPAPSDPRSAEPGRAERAERSEPPAPMLQANEDDVLPGAPQAPAPPADDAGLAIEADAGPQSDAGPPAPPPPSAVVGETADGTKDAAIVSCHLRNGGETVVGKPFDNGGGAYVHAWGNGLVQDFASAANGKSLCMRAKGATSAWLVRGAIRDVYFANGGGEGSIGYPVQDAKAITIGYKQEFTNKYIAYDPTDGKYRVYSYAGSSSGGF